MFHVHITAKPSTRFPGKNDRLWQYTRVWLANELQDVTEPQDVTVTIRDYGLDLRRVPAAWRLYFATSPTFSHESDLRGACRAFPAGSDHVLLQLTQPIRRTGLLREALVALRMSPGSTVMSSSGGEMDGALYAWRGDPACVFERRRPCYVSNIDRKIDIDAPSDVPANLAALWADSLLIQNPIA